MRCSRGAENMKNKLSVRRRRPTRMWMRMTLWKKSIVRTSPDSRQISLLIGYCPAELDPDSHPPTNVFQKFMNMLHHLIRWTNTAEAVVRLKISSFSRIDNDAMTASLSSDICFSAFCFGFPQYLRVVLVCDVWSFSCSLVDRR